ncbi:hypothetical protein [Streptomyces sp. NPDC049879]|uniref:hypothetical protein n=1 Tax=Streptomyces sp. NPDC049879 TaxID=3365598 RepID=UPI00378E090B
MQEPHVYPWEYMESEGRYPWEYMESEERYTALFYKAAGIKSMVEYWKQPQNRRGLDEKTLTAVLDFAVKAIREMRYEGGRIAYSMLFGQNKTK